MPRAQVAGAASEGYALHAERAGHGALQLRRLWLSEGAAARGAGGGEAHGLAHGLAHAAPARASAIHKQRRRSTGGGGRARLTDSVGAIFGATLKSVLDFSGVRAAKSEVVAALRHVARFFEPTRWDAAAVGGTDRDHLLNGLMAHRVDRLQRRHLPESREPVGARTYLGRNGLKDVAVGVTAAVLVAHYLMSARGARAADVCAGMRIALERASALLEDWPLSDGHADAWHAGALRAEERALQRARSAAVAAAAAAQAQGLPNHAALALQFEWMRAAAWPRGVCCDATTHAARCASLGQHGAQRPDGGGDRVAQELLATAGARDRTRGARVGPRADDRRVADSACPLVGHAAGGRRRGQVPVHIERHRANGAFSSTLVLERLVI